MLLIIPPFLVTGPVYDVVPDLSSFPGSLQVKTNPPTLRDFTSNQARGVALRGSELRQPEIHSRLSVHDNARTIVERATTMRRIGGYIAAVRVLDDGSTSVVKTLGEGHYTLWGDPAMLLEAVLSVVPVEPGGAKV